MELNDVPHHSGRDTYMVIVILTIVGLPLFVFFNILTMGLFLYLALGGIALAGLGAVAVRDPEHHLAVAAHGRAQRQRHHAVRCHQASPARSRPGPVDAGPCADARRHPFLEAIPRRDRQRVEPPDRGAVGRAALDGPRGQRGFVRAPGDGRSGHANLRFRPPHRGHSRHVHAGLAAFAQAFDHGRALHFLAATHALLESDFEIAGDGTIGIAGSLRKRNRRDGADDENYQ